MDMKSPVPFAVTSSATTKFDRLAKLHMRTRSGQIPQVTTSKHWLIINFVLYLFILFITLFLFNNNNEIMYLLFYLLLFIR